MVVILALAENRPSHFNFVFSLESEGDAAMLQMGQAPLPTCARFTSEFPPPGRECSSLGIANGREGAASLAAPTVAIGAGGLADRAIQMRADIVFKTYSWVSAQARRPRAMSLT